MELLAGKFLIDEFQEGGPFLPLIEELKLETSPASLTKLLLVMMLLSDINNNRHRVQELFQCNDDSEDNEEDIWKLLARQGLLSDEQFEKVSKLYNTDTERFLPTPLKRLRAIFGALWTEFTQNGSEMIKNKLLPVLKELLRRGGITDEQYSTSIKEFDKL